MGQVEAILARLQQAADDPNGYAEDWKQRTGRKVIGILPMNFPAELVHAAGALPVVIQENRDPITVGRSLIFEFYCGYTRSLTDQALIGQLDVFDGIFLVDHCVALLGAMDSIRFALPDTPVYLAQFTASMDEAWTPAEIRTKIDVLADRLVELCGIEVTEQELRRSIGLFNCDRQLLRQIYELRRNGAIDVTAAEMQLLVKSAMVMDVAEHLPAVEALLTALQEERAGARRGIRLHFSGHFCHAPRPELLALIEECGATVVDDDLFTGFRYIATDVPEMDDPRAALVRWYFDRNTNTPCSTRAQKTVDWERYLIDALQSNGASGVIILMPKFCEPHMLYYPELRKALLAHNIPHLLIETEHEGLALEMLRVRVEAFIEQIKRGVELTPEIA
jgi:benzoyl-CoA reductase subunit C